MKSPSPIQTRGAAAPSACRGLDHVICQFLAGDDPRVIETHASCVFLRENEAWKIKKPVRFSYLDYSSFPVRLAACQKEWRLNVLAAPELYLGVSVVTRDDDGRLRFDGDGEALEAVLRMRRFRQSAVFDAMALNGALPLEQMPQLGAVIAQSHRDARVVRDVDPVADLETITARLLTRFRQGDSATSSHDIDRLQAAWRAALEGAADVLKGRAAQEWVRRCHGDLHLRNIVLWNGGPLLFDALEFDDALATTDVIYDLAFVLMDLAHRHLKSHASALLSAYLAPLEPRDLTGLAALALFISVRAGVRACVALDRHDATSRAEAASYLRLTLSALHPTEPRLITVGGLSGSGKSRLAAALAPHAPGPAGAIVLRSDLERKAMAGVDAQTPLDAGSYTGATSNLVYDRVRRKAAVALAAGCSVIVDAVHARAQERAEIAGIARQLGVPFTGLWLDCPEQTRVQRAWDRSGDASDADDAVARRQSAYELGDITWARLDAAQPLEHVIAAAQDRLTAPRGAPSAEEEDVP